MSDYAISTVTAPAYEPVTVAEAREWCRIGSGITEHDWVLNLLIIAMREYAESLTGRAFARRTLKLTTDEFATDAKWRYAFYLPFPPLSSVSSLVYIDGDGAEQTMDAADYDVHTYCEPGLLVPSYQTSWPSLRAVPNAVQITYVAGYAGPSLIPRAVRTWMQARISTLFEQREQIVVGMSVSPIPRDAYDGLLDGVIARRRFA